jgi:DNA-binding GntR family transcriptional regulator
MPVDPQQFRFPIQEHGVSRGTVREAMAILRNEELVITIQGRGTFVRREAADHSGGAGE